MIPFHWATCQSGYGAVCKTVYPGSIPGVASNNKLLKLHGFDDYRAVLFLFYSDQFQPAVPTHVFMFCSRAPLRDSVRDLTYSPFVQIVGKPELEGTVCEFRWCCERFLGPVLRSCRTIELFRSTRFQDGYRDARPQFVTTQGTYPRLWIVPFQTARPFQPLFEGLRARHAVASPLFSTHLSHLYNTHLWLTVLEAARDLRGARY